MGKRKKKVAKLSYAKKVKKAFKPTKLFCVRKDGLYVSWDEKSMVEKPQDGTRLSRLLCERKYKGYEMIPFPEAYEQWFAAKQQRAEP